MKSSPEQDLALARLSTVFVVLGALWLAMVAGSFWWLLRVEHENTLELARTEARSRYRKDLLYRTWATKLGGLYVPVSPSEPDAVPKEDTHQTNVTTAAGKPLRFIEPDTIMRQVHELGGGVEGIQSHVTSLKPSRAENRADAWETNALQAFAAGSNEVASVEQIAGQPVLRLMRPMWTAAECLQCHEESEHRIGEIRGGISVMVPLSDYLKLSRADITQHGLWYGLFAVAGLAGLWFSHGHVSRSWRARNQALAAQVETEGRFRRLFDDVSNIAAQGCGPDGTVHFWNKASEQLYGYSAAEACGRKLTERIIPPEMRAKVADVFQQMMATGQSPPAGEILMQRKDGSPVPVFSSRTIVDTVGRGREFYCLDIDLSRRQQAEAASQKAGEKLRENEAELRTLIENIPQKIFLKDRNGRYVFINENFARDLGLRPADAVGKEDHDLFPKELADKYRADDRRIMETGQTEELEESFKRQDGVAWIHTVKAPVRDPHGDIIGVCGIFRDISEQRQLEQQFRQAQKMESFGQLAGGVAHDFNNILGIIQMQAGLLGMEASLSQTESESVREIESACEKATKLTQQLLLFSRKKPLEAHDVDLNEIVSNITKMLQRILGEDIAMQLNLTPGVLGVHADAGMIDQILLNLVVNARDAMANGGRVNVETAVIEFDELAAKQCPGARPGSFACLSVRDTGSGIPAEILPRIFEPFFTTKEVGKGTGLGLATVYGIVQQHHGWINVQSQLGQGTTFSIYLPRLLQAREGASVSVAAPPLPRGHETLLLVEDDPGLRAAIRRLLSHLGYRVLEAPDGVSAGTVWNEQRGAIQLLLTDMVMPGGITGKELGQRLRQEVPRLKVICMSGYSTETIGKNGRFADGLYFLEKPFQARQLAQMVRDCLDSV